MSYWRKVSARALVAARKSVGLETRTQILMKLAGAIAGSALIFYLLGFSAWEKDLLPRSLTAAIPFMFLPVVFVFKFVGVPPTMAQEAEKIIETLSKAVQKKATDEAILEALAQAIDIGNGIRGRFSQSHDDNEIKADWQTWQDEVAAYLTKHLGKTYASQFSSARATAMMGRPAGIPDGSHHYADIEAKNAALTAIIAELRR
jgi:hypothetical protein